MLKKTITYVDYDGTERTEDFYFNLSKPELVEMMADAGVGGLDKMLKNIVESNDSGRIYATFKDIVMRAYGEKSLDGKRMVKSPEISLAFTQTEAYSVLLMEFFEKPDKAAEFIKGIIPSDAIPADTPKKIPQN